MDRVTKELNFYLLLTYLNLNSYMWLEAIIIKAQSYTQAKKQSIYPLSCLFNSCYYYFREKKLLVYFHSIL